MDRHAHYRQVLHSRVRGGVKPLNANQERIIASQPTQALKDARRSQFESYNKYVGDYEEKVRSGVIPNGPLERAKAVEEQPQNKYVRELATKINEAGGYDKYYYGDNAPILFQPGDPDAPVGSKGSPAVSARRKIRSGDWEVTYADGSKEFLSPLDERYSSPDKIYASNPEEYAERVGKRVDSLREQQRKADESRSGVDKFFDSANDVLSNIADVGTIFTPGIVSTAYEAFRPGTRAERQQGEVQTLVNRSLQANTEGEKEYESFRTGRFKGLLKYDPELKQRIQDYDTYGSRLQQTLQQMRGQGQIYCGNKKTQRGKTKGSTLACFKKGVGVGMMIEREKAPVPQALETMTIRELGQVASKLKVPRYSRMKRPELIEAIERLRG